MSCLVMMDVRCTSCLALKIPLEILKKLLYSAWQCVGCVLRTVKLILTNYGA
jgi:hypothetical protein